MHIITQGVLSLLPSSFFLNNYFRWVFSTLSFNLMSFKMFPSYPSSMNFYFSIAYCFHVRLEWNRWFWSSTLGYTVCFFKWLWMTWMFMQIPDHWVFGRELSKSVALVFIYQWVQKSYMFLIEILCSNLIVLCLLLKFSKDTSSTCSRPVYIMNISLIYRKHNMIFSMYWYMFLKLCQKIFSMLGHRLFV